MATVTLKRIDRQEVKLRVPLGIQFVPEGTGNYVKLKSQKL